MSNHPCATGCGQPTHDVLLLCNACEGQLNARFAGVANTLGQARAMAGRQTHMPGLSDGGRSSETPIPIHLGLIDAEMQLRIVLVGWTMDLAELHGETDDLPADEMPAMASWLAQRMDRITTHPAAGDIYGEVCEALDRLERIGEPPAERKFVGVCEIDGCPGWLYAGPAASMVRCPECGYRHAVDDAQERVDKRLEDMLMTVRELAGWAKQFGIERRRAEKLLGTWLTRGRIHPVQHDQQGRAMLRYGPTMAMLRSTPTRRRGGVGEGAGLVAS